ncbi:MAG TPA: protein kinase, partial [Labilithrix sp.]|nr:protein kinase [Labilithrix sp.]
MRRIATGGTSDVLLAKAEGPHGFEREVVLKVLLSKHERDAELKAMFAREAAAYARLSHPSIVRLYDFFANGEQLVMVLEYVDGPPLSRLRGMLKTIARPFDDLTAIHVTACIFEALAAAHAATDEAGESAPVIHRDVNPSNVLVSWDAEVKLADFGIAKITGVNHQSTAGLIKGTYGYMAPEQVKGETVTPRADVYAGAIIFWEMLTKRRAFIRGALPEIEVLRELAEPRIVSIDTLRPDLDKHLREAIKRALEPRAEKRTMTAEELVATLRAAVSPEEGQVRLGKALALVRHEPKASPTSMPPPLLDPDEQQTGKVFPRDLAPLRPPLLPRPTPAPRPAATIPRRTAPYGAAAQPGATPSPPVLAPRPRPLEKEMPASTLSPEEVALVIEKGSHAGPPPARGPEDDDEEIGPSSVPGLASLLEPSSRDVPGIARRASERLRLGTPLAAVTAGRPLDQAIDDILRDGQPELGKLPPAPPTLEPLRRDLNATLVTPTGPVSAPAPAPSAAIPSSFPQMNRTLAMNERVDLSSVPPAGGAVHEIPTRPQIPQGVTAPMPAVPPPSLSPSTAKMRTFTLPQEALGSVPPPPLSAATATLPLTPPMPPPLPARARSSPSFPGTPPPGSGPPAAQLPPSHVSHSSQAATGSRDAPTTPSNRVTREPIPYPASEPPPARRSPVFTLLAVLFVLGAAVGAGALGYKQRQKARAAMVKPVVTATAVPTVSVSPLLSSASASAAPLASASTAPIASAAASPRPSAMPP